MIECILLVTYLVSMAICLIDYCEKNQVNTACMIITYFPVLNTIHVINLIRKKNLSDSFKEIKNFI